MDLQKFHTNLEMPRGKFGLVIFAGDDLHRVHRRAISSTRATVRGEMKISKRSRSRQIIGSRALSALSPPFPEINPPTEFILAPPQDLFFLGC